jgi:hypothetical protein
MRALQQPNFAFYGQQWTVLSANGTGYVLVEWTDSGVRLQKFNLDGTVDIAFGTLGMAQYTFAGGNVTPAGRWSAPMERS